MGDLPKVRLTPYGPIVLWIIADHFIKWGQGKVAEKRWGVFICIVCLNFWDVPLELAKSLETDDFMLALMRCLNRRGHVKEIRSDNGTNFVAADKEIKESLKNVAQSRLEGDLMQRGCMWVPPLLYWSITYVNSLWEVGHECEEKPESYPQQRSNERGGPKNSVYGSRTHRKFEATDTQLLKFKWRWTFNTEPFSDCSPLYEHPPDVEVEKEKFRPSYLPTTSGSAGWRNTCRLCRSCISGSKSKEMFELEKLCWLQTTTWRGTSGY